MLQSFLNSIGRINVNKVRRIQPGSEEHTWIMEQTPGCEADTNTFDRISLIQQGLTSDKTCTCGLKIPPKNKFCSSRCALKEQDRSGVDNEKANSKRKQTMLEKYGVEFNSQRPEVKVLLGENTKTPEWKELMRVKAYEQSSYIDRGFWTPEKLHEMNQTKNLAEIAEVVGCERQWVAMRLCDGGFKAKYHPPKSGVSSQELKIRGLLVEHGIEFISSDRNLISPKEVDIYIPEHNLAIEVNGLYWHSEPAGKDKTYHLNKTVECEKHGVQLLHFWDKEVEEKFDVISSMILQKCGRSERVFARKCKIIEPGKKEVDEFLERNHLQGSCVFYKAIGLEYENELVAVMTYGKPRFSKKHETEILRYATKNGLTIVGGFSRVLSRLNGRIVSYANLRYSNGNLYEKCGFTRIHDSEPAYWYTDGSQLHHRMKFQKHKIANGRTGTEKELALDDGFFRIWDCGNRVFEKNL